MSQQQYPFYDVFLPLVESLVGKHFPDESVIDVGANIGDTTALFRLYGCSNRIHAFEPTKKFAAYFRRNMEENPLLYKNVVFHRALVGSKTRPPMNLVEYGSSASVKLTGAESSAGSETEVLELSDCGDSRYCFVKIDTDGYDFTILENELPFIKTHLPALFFEAEIKTDIENEAARFSALMSSLRSDYEHIFLFDNFGLPFLNAPLNEVSNNLLRQAVGYTLQNASSHRTIYYFDIFIVPKRMISLIPEIKTQIGKLSSFQ